MEHEKRGNLPPPRKVPPHIPGPFYGHPPDFPELLQTAEDVAWEVVRRRHPTDEETDG